MRLVIIEELHYYSSLIFFGDCSKVFVRSKLVKVGPDGIELFNNLLFAGCPAL